MTFNMAIFWGAVLIFGVISHAIHDVYTVIGFIAVVLLFELAWSFGNKWADGEFMSKRRKRRRQERAEKFFGKASDEQ
jgi:hypothetical protein